MRPPRSAEFTSDWPEGQDGYTVQLQTLPKDGTQVPAVRAAKSDAKSKGATDVGALDSDDFSSLDGGNYVIYAGVFDTKKQANEGAGQADKADFSGREGDQYLRRRRARGRGRRRRAVRQEEGGHGRQGASSRTCKKLSPERVPEEGEEAARHDQAAGQGAAQGRQGSPAAAAEET